MVECSELLHQQVHAVSVLADMQASKSHAAHPLLSPLQEVPEEH